MLTAMIDHELLEMCRKALDVPLAAGIQRGDLVTFWDDPLPGRHWIYTGSSFVSHDEWKKRTIVDYGVRPQHIPQFLRK